MTQRLARSIWRHIDGSHRTRTQTPSALAFGAAAAAVAAAAPIYTGCRTPRGCIRAIRAHAGIPFAGLARRLAQQGARLPRIGANGPPHWRAAAVVADLVGAVAGGRRFSAMETVAGIHRRRVPDARGRLRDERLCRSQSRSAGTAHGWPPARGRARDTARSTGHLRAAKPYRL